jgi:hypothetical protein
MWVNQLFYLGVLEQMLCACLPYNIAGVLVCDLWLSWTFLLGWKFVVWRSAIAVVRTTECCGLILWQTELKRLPQATCPEKLFILSAWWDVRPHSKKLIQGRLTNKPALRIYLWLTLWRLMVLILMSAKLIMPVRGTQNYNSECRNTKCFKLWCQRPAGSSCSCS